jgi:hypothetical protein
MWYTVASDRGHHVQFFFRLKRGSSSNEAAEMIYRAPDEGDSCKNCCRRFREGDFNLKEDEHPESEKLKKFEDEEQHLPVRNSI